MLTKSLLKIDTNFIETKLKLIYRKIAKHINEDMQCTQDVKNKIILSKKIKKSCNTKKI